VVFGHSEESAIQQLRLSEGSPRQVVSTSSSGEQRSCFLDMVDSGVWCLGRDFGCRRSELTAIHHSPIHHWPDLPWLQFPMSARDVENQQTYI